MRVYVGVLVWVCLCVLVNELLCEHVRRCARVCVCLFVCLSVGLLVVLNPF